MVELCEVRMEILLQYTRAARNERSAGYQEKMKNDDTFLEVSLTENVR